MDIHGDILEEVVGDFLTRSGRKPHGILLFDNHALVAQEFLRDNSFARKPRKTDFNNVQLYASENFPQNLAASFVIHNNKPYGFLYHVGKNGKRGVARILNARNSFPLLSLPIDSIPLK